MSKHTKKSEGEVKAYTMREHLNRYKPRYVNITSPSGNSSMCNGDDVAQRLAGKSPEDVLALTEKLLGIDLKSKYASLNKGQIRMNCGNRIRSAIKHGTVKLEQVK
jgi:hypothetical protein